MNNDKALNKLILKSAYIVIIVLIIAIIALLILKYEVEGEKNMPFKLSSIIVVSNAEGYQEKQNKDYAWDVEIYQSNDIYLNIEKNKNYKETEAIKSVIIENININKQPQVGILEFYRPGSDSIQTYNYTDEFKIVDRVEYLGDKNSDIKNLKISNQGNTLIIRAVNKTGERYMSNEKEFEHNGRLLNKAQISHEQIKSKISFDLIISLESGNTFRTNIELDLPVGDISQEGSSNLEITDMKNIVFKRE